MTREETLDRQFNEAIERTIESLGLVDIEPDYDSVVCPFCNDVPPDCDCPDLEGLWPVRDGVTDGFVEVLARPITGGIWL